MGSCKGSQVFLVVLESIWFCISDVLWFAETLFVTLPLQCCRLLAVRRIALYLYLLSLKRLCLLLLEYTGDKFILVYLVHSFSSSAPQVCPERVGR